MKPISQNISYAEAVKSQTAVRRGIDNTPTMRELYRMKILAEMVFEPLRAKFKVPIGISSFYRSSKLNVAIGGSANSQHTKGQAMDIDADIYPNKAVTNKKIFDFIRETLDFDQLIWEYGTDENPDWVHVSFVSSAANRNQILRAKRVKTTLGKTKTVYSIYNP